MLYNAVVDLIGPVPAGVEPILYICCVIVLVWLLGSFFGLLWSFLQLLGGGKR